MKFYKLLAGFGLAVLASVSVNASAQTAACTWSGVYGYGGGGGQSYTTVACKTPSGTVIASRTDVYRYGSQYFTGWTCGTPSVSSGYTNTGITQGATYPALCNTIITTNAPVIVTPPTVVYPGTSCTWAHQGNYQGYDVYNFNCAGYGKVATKTKGYPWSYSSQGYTCRIDAVTPYILVKTGGATECDISKVTKP